MNTTSVRDHQVPSGLRRAWDGIAAGYDAFVTPTHMSLASEGLRRVGLRPGMRFLDVAAGCGALALPAARLGADVLATDLSPAMLERLRARAGREGLNVETRVMDGQALELEDSSFDVAGSQFGVMLFPDMPRGIREMVRVVRNGGRVLMNVFGDPREAEFLGFFVGAVRSVRRDFTGPLADPPPLPFQLQDPDRLRRELHDAGLQDVRVEATTERLTFESGAQLWDWVTNSNPIVQALLDEACLTPVELEDVRRALDRMVRQRAAGTGRATLTNAINVGFGTK